MSDSKHDAARVFIRHDAYNQKTGQVRTHSCTCNLDNAKREAERRAAEDKIRQERADLARDIAEANLRFGIKLAAEHSRILDEQLETKRKQDAADAIERAAADASVAALRIAIRDKVDAHQRSVTTPTGNAADERYRSKRYK